MYLKIISTQTTLCVGGGGGGGGTNISILTLFYGKSGNITVHVYYGVDPK